VRLIAINPKLRKEAAEIGPRLEMAKRPATRDEIIATVMREMPAWGVSHKNAGEWGVTYASYADALEGLSIYAIEDGVVRWNRGEDQPDLKMGGFPPRPAQLYILAQKSQQELHMAAYRVKRALEHVEAKSVEWTPERKAAEKARAIEMGLLNPDGSLAFKIGAVKGMPEAARPTTSRHDLAEKLRQAADDVGDVL
jgi:hypothetical protein